MSAPGQELWSLKKDKNSVVWLEGEVDYTVTPALRNSLLGYIKKTEGDVHINLSRLKYLDSSGLAVLIEARRHMVDMKRALVIDDITPEVRKIFELTQVGRLFGL